MKTQDEILPLDTLACFFFIGGIFAYAIFQSLKCLPSKTHIVKTTSYQRRCDIVKSQRRW